MTDPVTAAVVSALVTKSVSGLTEAGKTAWSALVRLVRRTLVGNQARPPSVLHLAQSCPSSDVRRRALAEALTEAMANDRDFAEQLADLWRQVQEGRTGASSQGTVFNIVSGDVDGNLAQARDIHGNVSFG